MSATLHSWEELVSQPWVTAGEHAVRLRAARGVGAAGGGAEREECQRGGWLAADQFDLSAPRGNDAPHLMARVAAAALHQKSLAHALPSCRRGPGLQARAHHVHHTELPGLFVACSLCRSHKVIAPPACHGPAHARACPELSGSSLD